MKRLVLLFVLFAFPALANEPGDVVPARGICYTQVDMIGIVVLAEQEKWDESAALFQQRQDEKRCEQHPMGTPVKLVKKFGAHTIEGHLGHIWSARAGILRGYIFVFNKP